MARKRRVRAVKLNKGASKALRAMVSRYGAKRGRSIFYAKANKSARRGRRPSQKANSVFGKGSRQVRRHR